jgi:hypothetical protein
MSWLGVYLWLFTLVTEAAFDHSHNDFDILLHRYVREGHVFYRELKRNREILDGYLIRLESVERSEFDSWTEKVRLAFLINTYNAWALKQVVDAYPVKSIRETGNVLTAALDRKTVRLFGRRLSLNQIRAGRECLRDPSRTRFDVETRQVLLADVFQRYVTDFSKPTGSVLKFIGNYLPRDQREMLNLDPKEMNVRFIAFDWGLNE